MEEWLKQNEILFKRDIRLIGEYVLYNDDFFKSFLTSSLREKYIGLVEGYLVNVLYNQDTRYCEKDGERLLRFLKLYVKMGLSEKPQDYYYNDVYQALLKIGEGPILKEMNDIYEKQNLKLDDFLEEFDPNQYIGIVSTQYEKKLKVKEKLNVRELRGMFDFYTQQCSGKLDRKKSQHLLTAVAQLSLVETYQLDIKHIELVLETFLQEIFPHLHTTYMLEFLTEEQMKEKVNSPDEERNLGLCKADETGHKLYINKEAFLDNGFIDMLYMIQTFFHECEHIQQHDNIGKVLNQYSHTLEIEETIIRNYSSQKHGAKIYYKNNYDVFYTELGAEEVAWNLFSKFIHKYFSALDEFIQPDCQKQISQIRNKKRNKIRLYDNAFDSLEVLFEKIMQEDKLGVWLACYPELKKEYCPNGRRKYTWELFEEWEKVPNKEEKKYYENLMLERDMSLKFLIDDYILYCLNLNQKSLQKNATIMSSYSNRLQRTQYLDTVNHTIFERKTMLEDGIKQVKEAQSLIVNLSQEVQQTSQYNLSMMENMLNQDLQDTNIKIMLNQGIANIVKSDVEESKRVSI